MFLGKKKKKLFLSFCAVKKKKKLFLSFVPMALDWWTQILCLKFGLFIIFAGNCVTVIYYHVLKVFKYMDATCL